MYNLIIILHTNAVTFFFFFFFFGGGGVVIQWEKKIHSCLLIYGVNLKRSSPS